MLSNRKQWDGREEVVAAYREIEKFFKMGNREVDNGSWNSGVPWLPQWASTLANFSRLAVLAQWATGT